METGIQPVAEIPQPTKIRNHCPFGCAPLFLDDNGYCSHLLGFTNDKETVEMIRPYINRVGLDTGHKSVTSKSTCKVEEGDILVNPKHSDNQGRVWNEWVSWRVYRRAAPVAKAAKKENSP